MRNPRNSLICPRNGSRLMDLSFSKPLWQSRPDDIIAGDDLTDRECRGDLCWHSIFIHHLPGLGVNDLESILRVRVIPVPPGEEIVQPVRRPAEGVDKMGPAGKYLFVRLIQRRP